MPNVGSTPADDTHDQCFQLGVVAYINSRLRDRAGLPVVNLREWIEPAILLRQIELVFDHRGSPVGYFTWAFLSDEISAQSEQGVVPRLHLSEWREGAHLWLLDMAVLPGYLHDQLRQMSRRFSVFSTEVNAVRIYSDPGRNTFRSFTLDNGRWKRLTESAEMRDQR